MEPLSYGDHRILPILSGIDHAIAHAAASGLDFDPTVIRAYEALKRNPNLTFEQLARTVSLLYSDLTRATKKRSGGEIEHPLNGHPRETALVLAKIIQMEQVMDELHDPQ